MDYITLSDTKEIPLSDHQDIEDLRELPSNDTLTVRIL